MLTRRDLLLGGAATALAACGSKMRRSPSVQVPGPQVTHGVQVGDVSSVGALIWARASEAATRMQVEWDTTARFASARRVAGPSVTPDTGLAATVALPGMPPGQRIFARARFEREGGRGTSEWQTASFMTPGRAAGSFRVAWTGDTCGQGFGRNPEWGGLRGYSAIRAAKPAFMIHSGDLIYADNPILAEQVLADGRVWRNITNEFVGRVAQRLEDFRGRFAYNLEDEHVRALAAEVPMIAQWDDHETHNNWWPGQQLDDARYDHERDASKLAAFARQAMLEWVPVPRGPVHRVVSYGPLLDVFVLDCRSFRTPNDGGAPGTSMLGAQQATWFIDAVTRSRATWKIIACDQPLGLIIPDGAQNERFEGFGNAPGAPAGREIELARILAGIRAVPNIVWVTADVHYAAAHHYDPARAAPGTTFSPFWEFVAGPIHAGTFGPNVLDSTFGPEVRFQWAPPAGTGNLAPWDGLQSFGTIDVHPDALTVGLWGIDGTRRFSTEITRA